MMNFTDVHPLFLCLLGVWYLFLIWSMTSLGAQAVQQKRLGWFAALLPLGTVAYFVFQGIAEIAAAGETSVTVMKMPVAAVCAVAALISAAVWIIRISYSKQLKATVSPMSVKQAVDSLPVAICFCEDSGRIVLKNNAMEDLCRALTGEALLNGIAFKKQIYRACNDFGSGGCVLAEPKNGRILSVSEEHIIDGNRKLILLTAADVTEAYGKTQILMEKKRSVEILNERLTEYNRSIITTINEREVLNAKVRLHNELGLNLLMSRRFIQSGGTENEREALIKRLRSNMQCLLYENKKPETGEYERIIQTARALNADIEIDGDLPEQDPYQKIMLTAMHECLTNTLRHARGDRLYIQWREEETKYTARFRNNGIQPKEPITEKGGLASLHRMADDLNGQMTISADKGFELTLVLPKGWDKNGL